MLYYPLLLRQKKRLKSLPQRQAYLEPSRASTVELYCEYT